MLWRIDTLISPKPPQEGSAVLPPARILYFGLLLPDFPGQAEADGFGGDHTLADLHGAETAQRVDDLFDHGGRSGRTRGQADGGDALQPAKLDVAGPVDQV